MKMLRPVRTIAPAVKPLTIEEARLHLRVDGTDEDTLIEALIDAATERLDGYAGTLGRCLITQTWQVDCDGFAWVMPLPLGNLISVTSISYYDDTNTIRTLDSSIYTALTDDGGPFIEEKPNQSFPSTYDRSDAVRITWQCGYGAAAGSVPMPIRQAMLLMIGHWFANREAVGPAATEFPMATSALLAPYIVRRR